MAGDEMKSPERKLLEASNPEAIQKPPADPKELERLECERVLGLVKENIEIAEDYRNRFRPTWEEIENQVRQVEPESWKHKADWQSKVYVGTQAKTSETAYANLSAMIFPTEKFFNISGNDNRDREQENSLEDLFVALMARGGFYDQKDMLLEETSDIGTSWMKVLPTRGRDGVSFTWRSPYDCLIDPHCGPNWFAARFWVDQYPKDYYDLLAEIRLDSKSLYSKDRLTEAIKAMESAAGKLKDDECVRVKSIDGTSDIRIPKAYRTVILNEFWGLLPMPNDPKDPEKGMTMKWMVVTLINKEFLIRKDETDGIPAVPARIKPRKYDFYGKGYLMNGRGIQDLINSMVNLGFDSQKINAMDIALIDENAIADQGSIQYKPLAVWKVKGDPNKAAVLRRHSAQSSMMDILNGLSLLDRIHQDVTGVTRHSEGAPTIDGKQGEQTLGEYQLKLQAVDRRFLSVARRFEEDFVKNLLRRIYKIVTDPKLFTQEAATRIIGMKPIMVQDPASGATVKVSEMPKLVLSDLSKKTDMDWDFRGSGVMQFSDRQRTLEKLQRALEAALKNPTLSALTDIPTLWKRIFQVADVPDWEEIIRSPEQVKELMKYVDSMRQGVPASPMSGGLPVPAGMPTKGMPNAA